MLPFVVDAMEGQDVSTADIPGAFLQTYYKKGDIHIKMEILMVTLLEYIEPEFYKYFIYIYICRKKYMYAETKKAVYSTLDT